MILSGRMRLLDIIESNEYGKSESVPVKVPSDAIKGVTVFLPRGFFGVNKIALILLRPL